MNFLLTLAQGFGLLVIIFLVYLVIPKSLWIKTLGEYEQYRKKAVTCFFLLAGIVVFLSAGMSYGPRIEVRSAQIPNAPQRVDVESGSELIEPSNRVGQFDDRLNESEEDDEKE